MFDLNRSEKYWKKWSDDPQLMSFTLHRRQIKQNFCSEHDQVAYLIPILHDAYPEVE